MNSGMIHQDAVAKREWTQFSAQLGAVVDFTSRLGHRYSGLEFDCPTVLKSKEDVNQSTVKWSSPVGAELWLNIGPREFTVGVKLGPMERPGRLVFWSILDPLDRESSISGLLVGRAHDADVVGKTRRMGSLGPNNRMLCVVAVANLDTVADREMLSMLAKGFSEAATDCDRDAWVSWLWDRASQGHLRAAYVKKLAAKILGPHVRQPAASIRADDSSDIVGTLERFGVFERGADYVLPCGLHAAVHVNLGTACGCHALLQQLAERVKQLLDAVDFDTIVSTGWTVAMIAREAIRKRPVTRLGVVRHIQCEGIPALPLAPVRSGSRAIVLTDVIVTGGLVGRVSEMIDRAGATVAGVITIVDSSLPGTHQRGVTFRSVCQYDVRPVNPESCRRCGRLERREFNPVACCMTSKKLQPRSPGQFLSENVEAAEFWKKVDIAQSYEHHRIEGDTHYVSFIDTEKLLAHGTVGPMILNKLVAQTPRLIGTPDVLLIPAKARARALAERLLRLMVADGRFWPPRIIAARQNDGRFRLTPSESQFLKHCKVLIVDTGMSSGSTMEELWNLANRANARVVAAEVIVSRLSESQEAAVSTFLGGRFWRLYHLPVRPLSIPHSLRHLCPVCARRSQIEEAASETGLRPIIELFEELNSRRRRRPSGLSVSKVSANRDTQIQLISKTEPPLLERCRRSTASGVTLHSLYAARNNGMAPLTLPEICDDKIPATNRGAMLEYLGSSVWKWSKDSLFPDAKRLLDERDPDEIWIACVGLLNRGLIENEHIDRSDCRYWVKALQKRLESSEPARQLSSKTVWNRLAFEVYRLLKNEPSSRPELRERFQNMHRACMRTPAEAGIMPILQIIEEESSTASELIG